MGGTVLAYYQSVNSLWQASLSFDPDIRELYDATYRFVRDSAQAAGGA